MTTGGRPGTADGPSAPPSSRLRSARLLGGCLFVATALLYLPSLSLEFLDWDDPEYTVGNPVVRQGLTRSGVVWAFTTTHFANWLPVTWLSHMLDVELFGLDPAGHHLTTALLHAANAALLLAVLRAMTGSVWRSAAAAALFAVQPLRAESVCWISERKDVLCGTFFLLTLLAYARYARRPSAGRFVAVALLYALGLMSKTMIVTLPCLLLLLDGWPLRRWRAQPGGESRRGDDGDAPAEPFPARTWPWLVAEKVPLLGLAAIACAWTYVLQNEIGATGLTALLTFGQRLANAVISVWRYVGLTLYPVGLSAFYTHPGSWPAGVVAAAGSGLVLAAAAAAVVARRRPYVAVGWFWFLGMLVPVSGVAVQAGYQSIADRYTYLPGIGLAILIAWGVGDVGRRFPRVRRVVPHASAVVLSVLAALTLLRQPDWRTDLDLFASALAVDPNNWRAEQIVAGRLHAAGDLDGAVAHAQRSLALEPRNQELRVQLSSWLLRAGRANEAVAVLRVLVSKSPTISEGRVGLARALAAAGDFVGADAEFAEAVRLAPLDPAVHALWAAALQAQGRQAEASAKAREALRMDPQNAIARQVLDGPATRALAPAGSG